jgi:hypothetical protein
MDSTERARSAGRRFASTAGRTGLAMGGGAIYFGAHALTTPSLYGTDPMNIPRRCWMVPVAGVIAGGLLSAAPKVEAVGLGVVGGAVAIGAEQIMMGISINRNKANLPQPAAGTSGVGSLLEPGDLRAGRELASQTGEVIDNTGALYQPPEHLRLVREAAGLSV